MNDVYLEFEDNDGGISRIRCHPEVAGQFRLQYEKKGWKFLDQKVVDTKPKRKAKKKKA